MQTKIFQPKSGPSVFVQMDDHSAIMKGMTVNEALEVPWELGPGESLVIRRATRNEVAKHPQVRDTTA